MRFVIRWFVSGLGLWIASQLLSHDISYGNSLSVLAIASLILAVVNTFIKPLVIILSLPAILFSLGLFMIVINGVMILIASALYEPFKVSGLGVAILVGIVIALVNYLVTTILEEKKNDNI